MELYIALALFGGGILGYGARTVLRKKSEADLEAKNKELVLKAKDEALKIKEQAKHEAEERKKSLEGLEGQIRNRESKLDERLIKIESELANLDDRRQKISEREKSIDETLEAQNKKLAEVAKMTPEQAKEHLLKWAEEEFKEDIIGKIKEQRTLAQEEFDNWAKKILVTTMERIAHESSAELTISPVRIASEEMKGRIIGKEGRNIQAFEKLTGVDVIIDESPDTITLSCFDPVRRHMAKVTMERLIADGRIHPGKIEEIWEKVEKDTQKEIKETGEQAAREAGITGLHPEVLQIMGQLKYRTSFGQNVLKHSIEMANLAGLIAAEIGADVNVSRKAAFLHDIGKALDHEIPSPHHHISMDIARKYGASEVLINAIGAHHDDIEPKTVEAIIVRIADAISGGRPGARRDSHENYVKRITELENIAKGFEGVDKTFAIHAGREIRVLVRPDKVSDLEAIKLSKNIARKIEQDLQYPGVIKVNVIRETRVHELAK